MNKSRSAKAEAKWRKLVAQWVASGKKAIDWCREQGVTYVSFIVWRKRLARMAENATDSRSSFVEITDAPSTYSGIEIRLRDLTLILTTDFDSETLRRCVEALEDSR